ncbi:hypothetical protein [Yeosuana marina]|uniref:hypothetical protein n=1 Tax=Yeosuana marina TaxID=1565536 RepID=UPI001423946B|nr:hypothetical protein [Yeosuana marina]
MKFKLKITLALLCLFMHFQSFGNIFKDTPSLNLTQTDSLILNKETESNILQLDLLILYQKQLLSKSTDSIKIFKKLAILNADFGQAKDAYKFTEKYISNSLDFSILNNHAYENIEKSEEFEMLNEKYQFKFDIFSLLYIYISLHGLFLT